MEYKFSHLGNLKFQITTSRKYILLIIKQLIIVGLVQALSGDTATGAMTYSFIQAAQNEPGLTYGRLLNVMRQTIRDSKTRVLQTGPVTSLLKKVLNPRLPQVII